VFENRVLRGISGLKRHEIIGGQGKVHNQGLCSLYSLPNIIRMINIKKEEMGGACSTHGREVHYEFWQE
jgi:hypothetical protein